ncbi:hypothetical protein [Metabacillus halosaccharovorans]|uniref:hypothetical protein n=1 Tax=Metabacillus halosaccharovorans TaxID=930124 RepID=UPI00203CE946|nr:hypothetical protein [Metabacillus halosaccharovorans]
MVSESDFLLFLRELDRLIIELNNCSDTQVSYSIYQDIQLLRDALVLTATE